MKTIVTFGALVTCLVSTSGCDPYFQVFVTVPTARPLPTACAESAFDVIVRPRRVNPVDPQGPPLVDIAFVAGQPYADLQQHVYKDSAAALETSVGRVSFLGGRFNKAEVDTIGRELSATLTTVRDACGGAAVADAPPYRVRQKPF